MANHLLSSAQHCKRGKSVKCVSRTRKCSRGPCRHGANAVAGWGCGGKPAPRPRRGRRGNPLEAFASRRCKRRDGTVLKPWRAGAAFAHVRCKICDAPKETVTARLPADALWRGADFAIVTSSNFPLEK